MLQSGPSSTQAHVTYGENQLGLAQEEEHQVSEDAEQANMAVPCSEPIQGTVDMDKLQDKDNVPQQDSNVENSGNSAVQHPHNLCSPGVPFEI